MLFVMNFADLVIFVSMMLNGLPERFGIPVYKLPRDQYKDEQKQFDIKINTSIVLPTGSNSCGNI